MGPTDSANAIFPIDLGAAAAFDQNVFPLTYYKQEGNLNKGNFLIKATLEEMEKIREQGIDLNKNLDFIYDTRLNVEALKADKERLQDNRKSLLNLLKPKFLNDRAARLFHEASRNLYLQTKNTSEKIRREDNVRVVPSTRVQMVDGELPPDATITGFSIELPDGLNDNAKRTLNGVAKMMMDQATNPFTDNPIVSQLRDDEHAMSLLSQHVCVTSVDEGNRISVASSDLQQSRPSSSKTITVNVIQNSIVTTNSSNLSGVTQNRGDRTSGASVTQGFAP